MVDSALKDLTKMPVMPALPKTKAVMQPKPTPSGMIGASELGPALGELSEAERQASMKVGEADIAIEEAKRQEKALEAGKKAELAGRMATEARELPERKALTEARTEFGNMAFVPTKETTQDLAGIFSLMGIVGMVVGKGNAQLAMSSMNGMLEGYQKGRADLYKKELTQFDKNFKAMQSKITTLEKELSEAMELKKLDREKGDLEITMALAKAESPVLNAMRNKQGDVAVLSAVQDTRKTLNTLISLNNDLRAKADARADAAERERRADERARLSREQAKQLAELRTSQPGRQGQNALTFASRVYGNIENATADLENILSLPATSQSPVFAGMIGVDRDTAFRSLTSLVAREITSKEERAFEQITNSLDAALARLEGQGLATGGTQAAIRSFSSLKPRAGDAAINLALYLARVKQEIQTGVKVHEKMPGATSEQLAATSDVLKRIDNAVPFNVSDVLSVLRGNGKPIETKMEALISTPSIVPTVIQSQPLQQVQPSVNPSQQKTQDRFNEERQKANAAIARGAPIEEVKKRFKQKTGEDL